MTSGAPTLGGLRRLNTVTLQNLTVTGNATITGTITEGADITLANGKALQTGTTASDAALLKAYDVDGTTYKTFATLTAGNTPSFAIAAPSGGTVAIDGATIGGTTAAAGTFTTVAGIGTTQTSRTSTALTKNANTTYADITGLTGITLVAGATYKFRAVLPSTVASGTGGIKYCFNYTTATLTSIESTAMGFTASAVAVQHTTTTTTQTDLFTQAAVVIMTVIEGTMVVNVGGTMAVQMAQNTSNASDTVALVGGTFQLYRIA